MNRITLACGVIAFVAATTVASGRQAASQSVELDKTVQRVNGTPIRVSDIREARMLKLLPGAPSDDAAVQTGLENRLLILGEVSRMTAPDPSADAIAARRRTWTGSWPAGTDFAGLVRSAGTTDQALDGWFRDELKIAAYLDRRFGLPMDDAREKRVNEWVVDLRRRANLTGRND